MKKLLSLLFVIPFLAFQTNNTSIDLKEYGLNATIINNTSFSESPEIKPSSANDDQFFELDIRFNSDAKIEIARIPAVLSTQKAMAELNKMVTQKHKGFSLKAIKKGANFLLTEKTTKEEITYKALYVTAQKGKNFLITTNDANDQKIAEQLLTMAKTLKLY